MRYIIIPLAIILYIWWSISSVKDCLNWIRFTGNIIYNPSYATLMWLFINGGMLIAIIIGLIIYSIILYW
jgi:hypothetical protein